jgi:hypothetical protein
MKGNQTVSIVAAAFVAGLVGGIASSWFLVGASAFALSAPQIAKVLQAESFALVDANGRQRAVLGPTLRGEVGLLIADPSGQVRAVLTVNAKGEPGLELLDEQGDSRASMAVRTGESGVLALRDNDGKLIWQAPPPMEGEENIALRLASPASHAPFVPSWTVNVRTG